MDIGWSTMMFGMLFVVWSVGVSDLIHCKTLLKISIKECTIPSLYSMLFNKGRKKPFVRDMHTHTHTVTKHIKTYKNRADTGPASPDSLQRGTDSDSHNGQGEEGRHRHGAHEAENSSLYSHLVKCLQGEEFWFPSFVWHQCTLGDLEFITNVFSQCRGHLCDDCPTRIAQGV